MERTVGQYRFLDRLGAGGLGEAFRARDTRLGRTVVVRCVPDDTCRSEGTRARLLTAAAALKSLSHPHLAELYDAVDEDGQLFVVSEYVDGETLAQLVGGRPLNPRRAAEIAAQIAEALAQAHAAGILHLDLRPDTIFVNRKGQAKVLDTGLSDFTATGARRRALAAGADPSVTPASAGYMSPEQALGESEDARSDIFSLGLVFYEMLTGEAPFHEADAPTTVLSVLRKTPPPPSTRNPAVPRYFDAVVARMISKSLHGRYDTAAAAAAALRRLAERQVPSDAAAGPTRSRRRPWIVAALLLVVAAAIAAWQWAGT